MNKKKLKKELTNFQNTRLKEEYKNVNFSIVLVRPETPGNIGSVARVMKNFDFNDLIIFNPIASINSIKSNEAFGFAMHGKDILQKAKVIYVEKEEDHLKKLKEFLASFDYVIATTAKGKHYRNIKRTAIFPEDLILPFTNKPMKVAILFGRESRGLTNDEIKLANISLRIPASEEYPTLNVSHACAIILHEIYKKLRDISIGRGKNPILIADREDKELLYSIINEIILNLKIRTHKKENVLLAFKNTFERSFISKKELSLIMGVFSKLRNILCNIKPFENSSSIKKEE
ncbi:MAG: RNA methyltransferase [Promethearchaeota archaeon]